MGEIAKIDTAMIAVQYLSVRHHHSHRSELNFQVLGQFLTSGVTRVLNFKTILSD